MSINVGCDPELFIKENNKIIGCEKVLPKDGLNTINDGKVIIDGIQAEFNPAPSHCRVWLGDNIRFCFMALKKVLDSNDKLSLDFTTSVTIDEEELNSLNPDNRVLGCMPSNSIYGKVGLGVADISKFFDRSLGGHIHLSSPDPKGDEAIRDYENMVKLMDILVGNTCVLIDRNEGNIKRRKTYGRAGEYRTPKHGIEYRTLSSFWLKSYQLMSFVMGLSKQAVTIKAHGMQDKFFNVVDMDDIQKAINENDFDLAMSNFNKILPVLMEVTPTITGYRQSHDGEFTLNKDNISYFLHFVDKVKVFGLEYWFKESPMDHWLAHDGENFGWERYLSNVVSKDMLING